VAQGGVITATYTDSAAADDVQLAVNVSGGPYNDTRVGTGGSVTITLPNAATPVYAPDGTYTISGYHNDENYSATLVQTTITVDCNTGSSSSSSTAPSTTTLPAATSGGDATRQCDGSVTGHAWAKDLNANGAFYEGTVYLANRQGDTLAAGKSDTKGDVSFTFTTDVPAVATELIGLKIYNPDGSVSVHLPDISIAAATGCETTTAPGKTSSSSSSAPTTTKVTVPSNTTTKVTHPKTTTPVAPSTRNTSVSLIPPTSGVVSSSSSSHHTAPAVTPPGPPSATAHTGQDGIPFGVKLGFALMLILGGAFGLLRKEKKPVHLR
jgi:hypothetical protein